MGKDVQCGLLPLPISVYFEMWTFFTVLSQDLLQSVLVKEVFSHSTGRFRRSDAGETANVVAQLLDGVMAVDEEVLLEEVTQLQEKLDE